MIIELEGYNTEIGEDVTILETAVVIGDVKLGPKSSIWFGSVLRGDISPIIIGEYTNIQDNCVVHTSIDYPTEVGKNCVVGHSANLHSCKIKDNCLIGIGAILLDGCEIGENSIIGAGTLIPGGKKIPANSLVVGNPYKILRQVTKEELDETIDNSRRYYKRAKKLYKQYKFKENTLHKK